MKYVFTYKESHKLSYNSAVEAVKDFNSRGYGMWNWIITKEGKEITLEQFNQEVDKERA